MTATASATQVAVSWAAVSGASSYEVHRNDGAVGPTAELSYNDTSVSAGTGYLYRIYAFGTGGLIAYSNVDLAVPFVHKPEPVRRSDPHRRFRRTLAWMNALDHERVTINIAQTDLDGRPLLAPVLVLLHLANELGAMVACRRRRQ